MFSNFRMSNCFNIVGIWGSVCAWRVLGAPDKRARFPRAAHLPERRPSLPLRRSLSQPVWKTQVTLNSHQHSSTQPQSKGRGRSAISGDRPLAQLGPEQDARATYGLQTPSWGLHVEGKLGALLIKRRVKRKSWAANVGKIKKQIF